MMPSRSEAAGTTDDTPTLRDEVLGVLAGAEGPIGLAAIAAELRLPSEDRTDLARVLHRLKTEGAVMLSLPARRGAGSATVSPRVRRTRRQPQGQGSR